MKKLSSEVNTILHKIFDKKGKTFILILQNWSRLVDEKFNKSTCPVNISYHIYQKQEIATLHVSAASHIVSFEFAFYKNLLIDKINLLCGFKAVHEINVKIMPK